MRIAAVVLGVLFFAFLAGSAWMPAPWWFAALYGAPVFGVAFAAALLALFIGFFVGPTIREILPFIGTFIGMTALIFVETESVTLMFSGMLEKGLYLEQVTSRLCATGALGGAGVAVWFGWSGLKTPHRAPQILGIVSISLGAYVLACIPIVVNVSFPAPWMCSLIVLSALLVFWITRPAAAPRPLTASQEQDADSAQEKAK